MKNKYEIRDDVTAIFIYYKGEIIETLIDTDDLEKVSEFPNMWGARYAPNNKKIYICSSLLINGTRKAIQFHRWIMDTPSDMVVDHINGDPLDNRKENLRIIDPKHNTQNAKTREDNKSSGHRGVTYNDRLKKWVIRVQVNKKRYSIGYSDNLDVAIKISYEARALLSPYSYEALSVHDFKRIKKFLEEKYNKPFKSNKTSHVRGVCWDKTRGKWKSYVRFEGKIIHLGYYVDLEEAAKARHEAEIKYYGKSS